MATLWDSIKKGAQIAAEKAEELGKKSKVMIEISSIKHKIQEKFTELGGRVYHLIHAESASMVEKDPEILKVVMAISGLEVQLKEKQEELKRINDESPFEKSG